MSPQLKSRTAASARGGYDVAAVRKDFPILSTQVHGRPLVYLDNAATTQKPRTVIVAMQRYYEEQNANVHRGVHHLSETATQAFEAARAKASRFVGAGDARQLVFTRGTTEALNLVASTFGRMRVGKGDEVLITAMEHHSNIVPWQMLCEQAGARLRVVPITDAGELDMDALPGLLGKRTKIMSLTHVSNALGTVNPVAAICKLAHEKGVPVVVDGAQAVPHLPVDVAKLGCDFYAASGHKMYGPTGIGFLHGKPEHLEAMPPYQGGGDMIRSVTFEKTQYNEVPYKFEAGTPHVEGAIGLAAAIDYLQGLGLEAIHAHEAGLLRHATARLQQMPEVTILGTAAEKAALVSFTVAGAHPHDVGTLLDRDGIAIRKGHHCAMPIMDRFGVPATSRASFGLYNTRAEVDALATSLEQVVKVFG